VSAIFNPKIFGLRVSVIAYLYWQRLRSHSVPELLAGSGVAIGVGLIVGVLALSSNTTRAGDELINGLAGHARFALVARSAEGFSERTAEAAGNLKGVKVAAYLMKESVSISGPRGRATVQLLGISSNLAELDGTEVGQSKEEVGVQEGGLGLPAGVIHATGARLGNSVAVLARGAVHRVAVRATLHSGHAKGLSSSPIAVAILSSAQQLAGRPGTVSSVLIEPETGAENVVARGLRALAGEHLEVQPANYELALLAQASQPTRQSTALFAAIGALVGLLLTFNAMLLTMTARRQFVADLEMDGYDSKQVLLIVCCQALALGVLASLLGVVIGEGLSSALFRQPTAGLEIGFPLGTRKALDAGVVLVALVSGVAMTLLSSLPIILDIRRRRLTKAVTQRRLDKVIAADLTVRLGVIGATLLGGVAVLLLIAPGLSVGGVVAIGVAVPCLIPLTLAAALGGLEQLSRRIPSSSLIVGVRELKGMSMRVTVVASVVALTVYSALTLSGVKDDIVRGTNAGVAEYFGTATLWVAPPNNVLNINNFAAGETVKKLRNLAAVASVREDQGSLLDVGDHRLLIDARSPAAQTLIPPNQLVHGNLSRANALLRSSGWAAISTSLASAWHLQLGSHFSLPTPAGPFHLKVAAITDLAWAPGAVTINTNDYRRYWQTPDPSALEVTLKAHVGITQGRHMVQTALGDRPGLSVLTASERAAQNDTTLSEDLRSLNEISTLLLIADAIAVALALSAAIWERRARLSSLMIQGYSPGQLWRSLLFESVTVVGVGCAVGAVGGVYAHFWASRFVRTITGLPAHFSMDGLNVVLVLAFLSSVVVAVIGLAGMAAARVSPNMALQE